jgi:hypothetical protein
MSISTNPISPHERRTRMALVAGAVLCAVASGGLLWWRYGGVIFNDMVTAALAWCF